MRVLYIVSLFPCWSETFIVREIHEMLRRGADVRIVSLRHASESMVQSDAAALLDRVIYPQPALARAASALGEIARRPLLAGRDLARLFAGLWRHPEILAKSLVTWWRALALARRVAGLAPDHIHAHFATYPSTAAMVLSSRLGRPFSFTAHAHDIFLEDHLLAAKMPAAAFVVAISRYNVEHLRSRVRGAERADVRVIHCGVSPEAFPYSQEGRDPRSILAIGRLDEIKGFAHLVEACALLKRRGLDFRCDVIGAGPLRAELEAQIERLGVADRVKLLGARKQEEVRRFLYSAGAFALPSVVTPRGDRDGIPVALMEAMASGLPVVSTRVSGIPELVEDGVTGLLAGPGDAAALADCLERLVRERDLAGRLAAAARARVEAEFEIGKEAQKLHDAIAGLA